MIDAMIDEMTGLEVGRVQRQPDADVFYGTALIPWGLESPVSRARAADAAKQALAAQRKAEADLELLEVTFDNLLPREI